MTNENKKEVAEIIVHLSNQVARDFEFLDKIQRSMFDDKCTDLEFRNRVFSMAGSLESLSEQAKEAAKDMGKALDKMLKLEEMKNDPAILHTHE